MSLLKFRAAYKLTHTKNGEPVAAFVAMGPKTSHVDGKFAVACIVNNPERFEQRFKGDVIDESPLEIAIEAPEGDEGTYTVIFEPLTMKVWKTIDVVGRDELLQELHTDADLLNYYMNDWMPDYWLEGTEDLV